MQASRSLHQDSQSKPSAGRGVRRSGNLEQLSWVCRAVRYLQFAVAGPTRSSQTVTCGPVQSMPNWRARQALFEPRNALATCSTGLLHNGLLLRVMQCLQAFLRRWCEDAHPPRPATNRNQLAGLLIGGHRLSKHPPKQANGASIPLEVAIIDGHEFAECVGRRRHQ
jgi:hypothetical protein